MLQQHLSRAFDHRERQPSQPRHLNAVALACRTRLDGMQKDYALGRFFNRDAQVLQSRQLLGQQSELMVVGGEERPRTHLRVEIFERRPGEREAVEGGCGAAVLRMVAVSVISTMKVERPRATLSLAPMRV